MPVKRSRIGSASGHQAVKVSTADTALVDSTVMRKVDAAGERSKILDIECPNGGDQFAQLKIGGFLERCHLCRKRIPHDSEVFMYSTLCAFCSAECRDRQIELDHLATKQAAIRKGKAPHG